MLRNGAAGQLPAFRFHENVNVLEEFPGSDAQNSVRELDEIVTRDAGVFATEGVVKTERSVELFRLNQKPGAICSPFTCDLHHQITLGGGRAAIQHSKKFADGLPKILQRDANVRAEWRMVNSTKLVQ